MMKLGKGCAKNALTDADNFSVPFPPNAKWEHKALLLAATLFIDFRMFENKDDRKGHHH